MITKTNNRCHKCNKHSIIMFKCKCDYEYCNSHRLPEKHSCTNMADFADKNELSKSLTKVNNSQIETI